MRVALLLITFSVLSFGACSFPIYSFGSGNYTIINKKYTFDEARTIAKQYGGYIAIPDNADENAWFIKQGWAGYWIGIHDPTKASNYCYSDNCLKSAARFRTIKGQSPNFSAWASGEPNNMIDRYDIVEGRNMVEPLGEHWAIIDREGRWLDVGNHAGANNNPYRAFAIVEFDGVPECNQNYDFQETELPEEPFCVKDLNGDNFIDAPDENQTCLSALGGAICPFDIERCKPSYIPAICEEGGALNADRDMCQKTIRPPCPAGYVWDKAKDKCVMPVSCGSGVASIGDAECRYDWSPVCPSGHAAVGSECRAEPICPSGGNYNATTKRCETALIREAGVVTIGTLNVSIKITPRPGGSSHDVFVSYSLLADNAVLSSGYNIILINAHSDHPQKKFDELIAKGNDWCSNQGGSIAQWSGNAPNNLMLNHSANFVSVGKCAKMLNNVYCPLGYPNRNNNACYTAPSCQSGSVFDATKNKCVQSAVKTCPVGTTYNAAIDRCSNAIDCKGGVLDIAAQMCVIKDFDPNSQCPNGYSYAYSPIGMCEKAPLCEQGAYIPKLAGDHTEADSCYIGDQTCPSGDHKCVSVPSLNNKNYCSPIDCVGKDNIVDMGGSSGEFDKRDDAPITEAGCLGNLYIFNGQDMRCKSQDTFASIGGAIATPIAVGIGFAQGGLNAVGIEAGKTKISGKSLDQGGGGYCCENESVFFGWIKCSGEERGLSARRAAGQCHYLGSYCSKKLDVTNTCVQRKKGFCCYDSVLSRVIHEQGRTQLGVEWGAPDRPNCRGFTPEEFQKLDFSRIDLSEFADTIVDSVDASALADTLKQRINSQVDTLKKLDE
jgi:conjugal transfer mating pair stabilization protein TraN